MRKNKTKIEMCSASGLKLVEEVAVSPNHYGLKIKNKNNQGST